MLSLMIDVQLKYNKVLNKYLILSQLILKIPIFTSLVSKHLKINELFVPKRLVEEKLQTIRTKAYLI